MLKPWLLFGSLLAAGAALAIGTGPTQPQTPQSPLEDRTPAASPSQPDAAVQEMPQRERTDEPSPSDPQERDRQDGVPIEPEAQRDR